jgi:hypothetical protein
MRYGAGKSTTMRMFLSRPSSRSPRQRRAPAARACDDKGRPERAIARRARFRMLFTPVSSAVPATKFNPG